MTKSKTPIFAVLALIGGGLLVLSVPSWMAYVLLSFVALTAGLEAIHNKPQWLILLKEFCLEFCGFCLLVGCFVAAMVAMYGLMYF